MSCDMCFMILFLLRHGGGIDTKPPRISNSTLQEAHVHAHAYVVLGRYCHEWFLVWHEWWHYALCLPPLCLGMFPAVTGNGTAVFIECIIIALWFQTGEIETRRGEPVQVLKKDRQFMQYILRPDAAPSGIRGEAWLRRMFQCNTQRVLYDTWVSDRGRQRCLPRFKATYFAQYVKHVPSLGLLKAKMRRDSTIEAQVCTPALLWPAFRLECCSIAWSGRDLWTNGTSITCLVPQKGALAICHVFWTGSGAG